MIRNILLVLFIFTGVWALQGQTFDYDTPNERVVFSPEPGVPSEAKAAGTVTNLQNRPQQLYWVRNEVYLPDGWSSAVCDNVTCYLDHIGEKELNLADSEVATFDVYARTNGFPGDSAVIEVCVFTRGDSANTAQCHRYTFIVDSNSSSIHHSKKEPNYTIAPNPVDQAFLIPQGTKGIVEIYNIVGAKVKRFESSSNTVYDVSDLHTGIYLVRIYDSATGRVVSTQRLKKM